MSKAPNPGSVEAVERGCKCPVLGNENGRGAWGSEGVNVAFWITPTCPMHGSRDVSPAMDRIAFYLRRDQSLRNPEKLDDPEST